MLCAKRFDAILIEATGISEPMPVAASFAAQDAEGRSLKEFFKIDNMVLPRHLCPTSTCTVGDADRWESLYARDQEEPAVEGSQYVCVRWRHP